MKRRAATADSFRMPRRVWRTYEEYLQSWDWLRLRNREFARTDYRCESCGFHGTDKQLELHHLHYGTLGREQAGDLQVLCKRCHRTTHGLTLNGREVVRRFGHDAGAA